MNDLIQRLEQVDSLLEAQMKEVADLGVIMGCTPMQVRYKDGKYAMTDLLVGRAQCLHALTLLRTADG